MQLSATACFRAARVSRVVRRTARQARRTWLAGLQRPWIAHRSRRLFRVVTPEVASVKVGGERDQGDVDPRKVAGEPPREIDIGHRAALRADAFRDLGEWAAES